MAGSSPKGQGPVTAERREVLSLHYLLPSVAIRLWLEPPAWLRPRREKPLTDKDPTNMNAFAPCFQSGKMLKQQ